MWELRGKKTETRRGLPGVKHRHMITDGAGQATHGACGRAGSDYPVLALLNLGCSQDIHWHMEKSNDKWICDL